MKSSEYYPNGRDSLIEHYMKTEVTFVHHPKTGGTALAESLFDTCNPKIIHSSYAGPVSNWSDERLQRRVREKHEGFPDSDSFTILRHPLERLISEIRGGSVPNTVEVIGMMNTGTNLVETLAEAASRAPRLQGPTSATRRPGYTKNGVWKHALPTTHGADPSHVAVRHPCTWVAGMQKAKYESELDAESGKICFYPGKHEPELRKYSWCADSYGDAWNKFYGEARDSIENGTLLPVQYESLIEEGVDYWNRVGPSMSHAKFKAVTSGPAKDHGGAHGIEAAKKRARHGCKLIGDEDVRHLRATIDPELLKYYGYSKF